jgi:hypothetical protein
MTCGELHGLLIEVLDDEASVAERALVQRHLEGCAQCRAIQAAGQALRQDLIEAQQIVAEDSPRDEQLLAILRRERVCRGVKGHASGVRGQIVVGTGWGGSFRRRLRPDAWRVSWPTWRRSLGPAVAATAASFLLTWGTLRGAERGPALSPAAPLPPNVSAAAPALDGEALDRWMADSPTLENYLRLRAAPQTERPKPVRRGAVPRLQNPVG